MRKIKTGDNVIVIAGKEKGKTAEVLAVLKQAGRLTVVVKGVNMVKRHQKSNQALGITGGINEIAKPIDISNVMLVDAKSGKGVRAAFKIENDKKVRYTKTKKSSKK